MKLLDSIKSFMIEVAGYKKQIKKHKLISDYYKNALEREKNKRKQLEQILYKVASSKDVKIPSDLSYEIFNTGSIK